MEKLTLIITVLLLSTSSWGASDLYRCFKQKSFDLCVPSINKGKKVIAVAKGESQLQSIDRELKTLTKNRRTGVQARELTPESKAEIALQNERGGKLYDLGRYFPRVLRSKLNESAGYSGPNCYNAALIGAGTRSLGKRINVGPKEFEAHLKIYYREVSTPRYGDVVVFDSDKDRGHAAFYLFNDLVLHKKGYLKGFLYRITHINDVHKKDLSEWTPSPFSSWRPVKTKWGEKKKAFYRRKGYVNLDNSRLNGREAKQLRIMNYINSATIKNAGAWSVGKKMGVISEEAVSSLKREFKSAKRSQNRRLKLAYYAMYSMYDQINTSIRETHFSSRFARKEKIYPDICFHKNSYTDKLIKLLLNYYGVKSIEAKKAELYKIMKNSDLTRCQIDIVKIIKKSFI